MGDQRGLPKKSNYFGGLGGLVGQDDQGDGGVRTRYRVMSLAVTIHYLSYV